MRLLDMTFHYHRKRWSEIKDEEIEDMTLIRFVGGQAYLSFIQCEVNRRI